MIVAGVISAALILFTRETRASVLLSRRARKMRREVGDDRYQCRSDAERSSLAVLMRVSMTRPLCESASAPFKLACGTARTHGPCRRRSARDRSHCCIFLSMGRLHVRECFPPSRYVLMLGPDLIICRLTVPATVEAVPLIFKNVVRAFWFGWSNELPDSRLMLRFDSQYGFNEGEVGLTFYALVYVRCSARRSGRKRVADIPLPSLAATIGFASNFYQERLYKANVGRRGPEARLYASLIGGLLFPIGAFILAFTQGRTHWMGPVVGLTIIFIGIYTIYLAVFSYLADCYTIVRVFAGWS